ncbi:MAG: DUF4388 domain-containing protein [Deltaproteobacteria bacterium]|nr:DUF4388 domain-containing protein [Deltaproteobacteria bacterium]
MTLLQMDANNRLTLPHRVVKELGIVELELNSWSDRHLLFTVPVREGKTVLAGFLGEVTVGDLLSFFNMFRKTGVLRFNLTGGKKELFFQLGEIVMATSTFVDDELGEVLYSLGRLDRETLESARNFANNQASLGKNLVEQELITAKDLWHATRYQVESIVYGLFQVAEGGFSFLSKSLSEEEMVRLSMSTQNLIMEGLRRIDERGLFMRALKSMDALTRFVEDKPDLTEAEAQMLAIIIREEDAPVRQVIRKCGCGEFEGLQLLFQLVQKGAVEVEILAPKAPEGDLADLLTIFSGALTLLFRRIMDVNPRFHDEVTSFLREIPQPYSYVFRGAEFFEDGTLNCGVIQANLEGLEEGDKRRLLVDAFNELVFMECSVARRDLGSAESHELVERIQQISQRVREMVEAAK